MQKRIKRTSVTLLDMAPFVGLVFSIVCFYMLTGRFSKPSAGIVALERLPHTEVIYCMPDNTEVIIGLDTIGRYSFAVTGPLLQAAIIEKVGAIYGIRLNTDQRRRLQGIQFLATNVLSLPRDLSQSPYAYNALNASFLNEEQMIECVKSAKSVIQAATFKTHYVCLLIDGEANASKVMRLIDALQAHGINRFNFKTQGG